MEVRFRFWIEHEGKAVMGRGGYEILKGIDEFKSISKTSKKLGMSYRFIWDYIRRMEGILGEKVVESERGGSEGGRTVLTPLGKALIETYERFERILNSALKGYRGVVEGVEGDRIVVRLKGGEFEEGNDVVVFKV